MKLPDFLTRTDQGDIRLAGHRIGLHTVVRDYKEGYSEEEIQEEYPSVSLELIRRVIDFYFANRSEVDVYVADTQAELDRQFETGRKIDMAEVERWARARGMCG